MNLVLAVAIGIGAGVGTSIRYIVSLLASRGHFPWGTVIVNVAGAAFLGGLSRAADSGNLGDHALLILGAGLAGGLTTFSTLAVDAARLWRAGRQRAAVSYLVLTVVGGILAAAAGWSLAGMLGNG